MSVIIDNWRTQIRKGYLELCLLSLIASQGELYGFDILEKLRVRNFDLKEGTLYPILNRMTTDGILKSKWETENVKGHPRKFYSLTEEGRKLLGEMQTEFFKMTELVEFLKTEKSA